MESARMWVTFGADASDFTKGLDKLRDQARNAMGAVESSAKQAAAGLGHLDDAADRVSATFKGALGANLVADGLQMAASAMVDFGRDSVAHFLEVEEIAAQTAAAIASTGGAAGVSADAIGDLANSIEAATGVSGEMIQRGENLLLTFTNIKDRAGQGNDVFTQTTKIMTDLSVAMGQDATTSAIQLGKALNDPAKGVTALQRVGVSFTEAQKDTIKALQQSGHTMQAQKIILAELTKEFGGSAKAFGETGKGAIEKFNASLENMGDAIVGSAMPIIKNLANTGAGAFNEIADTINRSGVIGLVAKVFTPEVTAVALGFAAAVTAAVVPALATSLVAAAATAKAAIVAATVAYGPFLVAGAAIAGVAYLIIKNWEPIKGWFVGLWNGLSDAAGTFFDNLKAGFQAATRWVGTTAQKIASTLGPVLAHIPGVGADLAKSLSIAANAVDANMSFMSSVTMKHARMMSAAASHNWDVLSTGMADVMDQARASVTGAWDQIAGAGRDLGKHLKAVGQAGADAGNDIAGGAKKAAGGTKKAADEMKRHADDLRKAFDAIAPGLDAINKKAAVLGTDGLTVAKQRVQFLEGALGGLIDKGVAPTDKAFLRWVKTLDVATADLDKLTRAAKAADLEASLGRDLAELDLRFRVLGESSQKLRDEEITLLRKAILDMAKTMGEAAPQVTALQGQLAATEGSFKLVTDKVKEAKDSVTGFAGETALQGPTMDVFKEKLSGTAQAVSLMREGLSTIGQVLGAEFSDPISAAIGQVLNLGLAVFQVVAAAPQVIEGITSIVDAVNLSLGPWGLVAAGIGVVIGALFALGGQGKDTEKRYEGMTVKMGEDTRTWAEKTVDWLSWVKDTAAWALDWATSWARAKPSKPVFDSVDALANHVVGRFQKVRDGIVSSFSSAASGAMKAFLDGTKPLGEALRAGIRDAITSGIVEAVINRGVIEGALGPLMSTLSEALASPSGNMSAVDNAVKAIGNRIPALTSTLERVLGPLKASLDRAFNPLDDRVSGILDTRSKAFADTSFKANTLGSLDAAGALGERISATEKAMTDLRAAGAQASNQFGDLGTELARFREQLAAIKAMDAAAKAAKKGADKGAEAIAAAYAPAIASIQGQLSRLLDIGKGAGTAEYDQAYSKLRAIQAEMNVPALASGGLTSGATLAMVGEAGPEAVLPLNDAVYARLGRGIAESGGGGGGVTVVIQYTGSGKWTRQDARELGGLIVNELRAAGVRP